MLSSKKKGAIQIQVIMKRYLIYFIAIVFFSGCKVSCHNTLILKKISKTQKEYYKALGTDHLIPLTSLAFLRQKVFNALKDSINLNNTEFFYVLEANGVEDGSYIGRVWNSDFDIRYHKKAGDEIEIILKDDTSQNVINNFFDYDTRYMCSLIEQWDVGTIKKISNESKVLGGLNYLASYIEKEDGKFKVSCLSFYEFPFEYRYK